MDPHTLNLIISLISGAVGGNVAGAASKENNLGVVANSILGLLGGGAGNAILTSLGYLGKTAVEGGLDVGSLLANIGTSGVSGAILMFLGALLKGAFTKRS